MGSIFLELRLEKLVLMIRYRFLVQDEDVSYVIVMDLHSMSLASYKLIAKGSQPFPLGL